MGSNFNLRQLIREELRKILLQETFHPGETVLHMGQRFTVVSDDGNIGVRVKTNSGKIKMINRKNLTKPVNESKMVDFLKDLEPGTYKVSYKYKDYYGDITQSSGKFTITQQEIDENPDMSLINYLEVLSIYSLDKIG